MAGFFAVYPVGGGGGSSGANTTLSNLTAPTAINQDLLPDGDFTRDLGGPANHWETLYVVNILNENASEPQLTIQTTQPGGDIAIVPFDFGVVTIASDDIVLFTDSSATIRTRDAVGSSASDRITLRTGNGVDGFNTGRIDITTGNAITTGRSGDIRIMTGSSEQENSGNILLSTATPSVDAHPGQIRLIPGDMSPGGGIAGGVVINRNNLSSTAGGSLLCVGAVSGVYGQGADNEPIVMISGAPPINDPATRGIVNIMDTSGLNTGVGGSIVLGGAYAAGPAYTGFVILKAAKSNTGDPDTGGDFTIQTRSSSDGQFKNSLLVSSENGDTRVSIGDFADPPRQLVLNRDMQMAGQLQNTSARYTTASTSLDSRNDSVLVAEVADNETVDIQFPPGQNGMMYTIVGRGNIDGGATVLNLVPDGSDTIAAEIVTPGARQLVYVEATTTWYCVGGQF